MKNRPLGIGVLLLGMAAVGYVILSWLEHPNRQRELDLKSEDLQQHAFEFGTMTIAGTDFPLLLEKKSGITYRLVSNPEIMWVQMQYVPLASSGGTRPFVQSPLTPEERKVLEGALKKYEQ